MRQRLRLTAFDGQLVDVAQQVKQQPAPIGADVDTHPGAAAHIQLRTLHGTGWLVDVPFGAVGHGQRSAELPGIAIAFIVTESRAPFPMLLGALIAGVLTAVLTHFTHRFAKVPEDAAMGVVFTSLFALGVILITRAASHVDLDPGCVLYGVLESAAIDTRRDTMIVGSR